MVNNMGIFRDYNKPGKGVGRNEPDKKGIARYFEMLTADIGSLLKLNFLLLLFLLPSQISVYLFVSVFELLSGVFLMLYIIMCLFIPLPFGAALAAVCRCLCSLITYKQGYVLHEFRKVFRHSHSQSVAVGLFTSAVMNAYGVFFISIVRGAFAPDGVLFLAVLLSMLVFFAVLPTYFMQAAYLKLGVGQMLKNSLLIFASHLPRCMAAAFVLLFGFLFVMVLFPISLLYLVLLGYILPLAGAMLILWKPFDQIFNIEKSLNDKDI